MAVQQNNVDTVGVFYEAFKNRRIDINQTTTEQETAMHMAAKTASTEMIKLLVELGGNYAARDEDGNTPLHDILQLINLEASDEDDEKIFLFYDAWGCTVDNCVPWWCKRLNISIPDKDSNLYREMWHDAMYCLRSEITNSDGLSVLRYAATIGLPQCVQVILTHKNMFVYQRTTREKITGKDEKSKKEKSKKTKEKPKFEIEVSNLIPEYSCKLKTTYKTLFGNKLRNILKRKSKKSEEPQANYWLTWRDESNHGENTEILGRNQTAFWQLFPKSNLQ